MNWILVIIVTHAITITEFKTKELCTKAMSELNVYSYVNAKCFKKQ